MKYINHEKFGIIIFEDVTDHKDFAELLPGGKEKVTSAGFIQCADSEYVACAGGSVSLGVRSNVTDTDRLRRVLIS